MSRQLTTYRAWAWLASALPAGLSRTLAEGTARLVSLLPDVDGRRSTVASHMERVAGRRLDGAERRRLVGDVFANYGRYWAESLRLPATPFAEVVAATATVGEEHLMSALEKGKGVIIVAPHLGGWEWGAFYLTGRGLPMAVAVEPLKPPDLFDWFAQFRRKLGMEVVPSGPHAAGKLLRALRANHIVCLLADRLVGETSGIEVEFFGAKARLPAGPVMLALRSGAALMTAAIYYDRPEAAHTIVYRPALDVTSFACPEERGLRGPVQRGTQVLAHELEELIKAAPAQWHLVQPNWDDDPPLRKWAAIW